MHHRLATGLVVLAAPIAPGRAPAAPELIDPTRAPGDDPAGREVDSGEGQGHGRARRAVAAPRP